MTVNEFSLPVKQLRTDTYYFRLMLALVIPQIETSVVFVFNLRLHIVPDVTRIEIQDLLGQCPGRSWSCSGHW